MKLLKSTLGVLLALLFLLPLGVHAEETSPTYWSEAVTKYPAGYTEDSSGNVTISTAEALAWLASEVGGLNGCTPDNFAGKTVTLENDIDVSAYYWTPIGNQTHPFRGIFNGAGFSIQGLRVYTDDGLSAPAGLFGRIDGATISHTKVSASQFVWRSSATSPLYVGGICGISEQSILLNVSFSGNIHATLASDDELFLGLLCGMTQNSRLLNVYTVGSLAAACTGRIYCGGMVALLDDGELINGFSSASLSAAAPNVAEIFTAACIGRVFNQSTVNGCYWDAEKEIKINNIEKKTVRGVDESIGKNAQSIGKFDADLSLKPTDDTTLIYGDALVSALNLPIDSHEDFAPWSDDGHLPILVYIQAAPPVLSRQPGNISLTLGRIYGKLEVEVLQNSGCAYTYRWYLDGKEVEGATGRVFYLPSSLSYENGGKHTAFCSVTSHMKSSGKSSEILTDVANIEVICVNHDRDEGEILREAGPGVEGGIRYTCKICGEKEIVIIPAEDTHYTVWVYFIIALSLAFVSTVIYIRKNKPTPLK